MRQKILLLSIFAACCQTLPPAPSVPDPSILAEFHHARTFALHVLCPDGNPYMGSAIDLGNGQAISAAHVFLCEIEGIEYAPALVLAPDLDQAIDIDEVVIKSSADLALFKITQETTQVEITPAPRVGSTVYFSAASPIPTRRSAELIPNKYDDQPTSLIFSTPIHGGNSGGGLWRGDQLIGVLTNSIYCAKHQICGGVATELSKHVVKNEKSQYEFVSDKSKNN